MRLKLLITSGFFTVLSLLLFGAVQWPAIRASAFQQAHQPNRPGEQWQQFAAADLPSPSASEPWVSQDAGGRLQVDGPVFPQPSASRGVANVLVLVRDYSSQTALSDVATKLQGTGIFARVDIRFVSGPPPTRTLDLPTLGELEAYDSLLYFTDRNQPGGYYTDTTEIADLLADYIDSGRGVVLSAASGAPTSAHFATDGYAIFTGNSVITRGNHLTIGSIDVPGHPVMAGVASYDGGSESRHAIRALTSGSAVIARYHSADAAHDGHPLVIEKVLANGARRVDLNFYPVSKSGDYFWGWETGSDGARLIANALKYVTGAITSTGTISFSTPYARDGDEALLYATVKNPTTGQPIKGSSQVTATLTGVTGSLQLYDDGSHGDLRSADGVYSAWPALSGSGSLLATLYYSGTQVVSNTTEVISSPHLVVLTDIKALYDEYVDIGLYIPGEDSDNNKVDDFYDALARLNEYAAKYKGLVVDVRRNIAKAKGFPVDYSALDYGGDDKATNRFQMAKLIDQLLTHLHRDSQHTIANVAIIGDDEVIPFYRLWSPTYDIYPPHPARDDNPTNLDDAADYLMTDVPYGTVDYVNQELVQTPGPRFP